MSVEEILGPPGAQSHNRVASGHTVECARLKAAVQGAYDENVLVPEGSTKKQKPVEDHCGHLGRGGVSVLEVDSWGRENTTAYGLACIREA